MSVNQIQADNRRMKRFIGDRISPDRTTRIILANGGDGPAWVDLFPFWDEEGCDLTIQTNEPDAFGLRDVYDHFRCQEMTSWEREREMAAQINRWKIHDLERKMAVRRVWSMPNKWTFLIPPFRKLLEEEMTKGTWVDPFAGKNSPATVRNDLNSAALAEFHLDALAFLQGLATNTADGVLYDPPYSIHQANECYESFGKEKLTINVSNMKYWSRCKDELARITKPGGKAICFGWNSMGLGANRGFSKTRVLMCAHGGRRNDTICTVEVKAS